MAILEARALTVRYGAREALSSLELTIAEGITGLLGPNGAGKSTLLKTFLGFLSPTTGTVSVLGQPLMPRSKGSAELRTRLGYFPERPAWAPSTSAIDMVALAGELGGLARTDALERAHEMLWFVGLGDARYRLVEEFSTGMRQRTKLACALVHDPDVVLLDEPTSGLDPVGRRQMLELVREVAKRGVSVLLSTHLLHDVEQVSDGVVLLDRGRLALAGTLASIREQPGWVFELRVRESEQSQFAKELSRRGIETTRERDGLLRVTLDDRATRPLFEVAHASGAAIRHLRRYERSLNDSLTSALARARLRPTSTSEAEASAKKPQEDAS